MASNIRQLRESKGMSQFELAIASRTPQSLLSSLETGKMKPWPAVIQRLSKALKVSPAELFTEDKESCATRQ